MSNLVEWAIREFSFTERGARKLIRNGYQYMKQQNSPNGRTSWECIERRKWNCKANIPNLSNLTRNIRLQRQEQRMLPNPPRKEDVPLLPHEYQMTGTGERYLIFDSGVGNINRMFIFTTNDGTDILVNSSQWFGDGTFKLCSQIFSQIYTIHALVNHEVLPCVFALLPSKAEIVYEQFFTTVRNAVKKKQLQFLLGLFGEKKRFWSKMKHILPKIGRKFKLTHTHTTWPGLTLKRLIFPLYLKEPKKPLLVKNFIS